MEKFTDFYEAWWYLQEHGAFVDEELKEASRKNGGELIWSGFDRLLDIDVVKVCPETDRIEDDESRNTETRVWLELGPYVRDDDLTEWARTGWCYSHDTRLDCGGKTFEEAIINLANKVEEFYPIDKYGKI